jgi:hypothetical protein
MSLVLALFIAEDWQRTAEPRPRIEIIWHHKAMRLPVSFFDSLALYAP